MKRALVILSCALSACGGVDLKDFPRPFACDHNGGDGGVQCAAGWRCGFDDRCFDEVLDGGQLVTQWQCTNAQHCPPLWQCSQEVDGIRNCQQVGVGAPTRCVNDDDGGCQGGWRCAATERCFDPTDTDGGITRDCSRDGECPNGYLCGEAVAGEQKCVQKNFPAPSPCNTDEGCQGGGRCNTSAHRCVQVTDVVPTGQTSAVVTAIDQNARVQEPAPLLLAATRGTTLPQVFASNITSNRNGILIARLFADGGVRVTAQFSEEHQAQGNTSLYEVTFGIGGPASDVTDLALSFDGPAVRFSDGTTRRLLFDGGVESLGPTDFLRQRDGLGVGLNQTGLVRVNGRFVLVDGAPPAQFGGGVGEVVVLRDTLYALTDAGFFSLNPPPDAGPHALTQGAMPQISLPAPSRGVVAGLIVQAPSPSPRLSLMVEVAMPDGGSGLQAITERAMGWSSFPAFAACPDGSRPVQLAFDQSPRDGEPLAFSRCVQPGGATYPVQVSLNPSGAQYESVIEDQTPFQSGVVTQRASPFVRAHAGADGRVWHVADESPNAQLGRAPLRPMLLDRQPDTMLSFFDADRQVVRVFAEAAGRIFVADTAGGFVSQLSTSVVPLSIVDGRSSWVLLTSGLIVGGARPTYLATMPPGEAFVAPASAVAVQVQLGSRLRDVVLASSGDTLWVADVTDAQAGGFAQPAQFERALVPVPGVRLRSMTITSRSTTSVAGFLTTSTQNLSFGTSDLVRWSLTPVVTPPLDALPLEVWTDADGGPSRTGYSDGRVWSLPIMVPLTTPLPLPDGGAALDGGSLTATDFGRLCGDLFAVTSAGVFRAERGPDGGLPGWVFLAGVNSGILEKESLRLYETQDDAGRLFIGTKTGQVVELIAPCR